MKWYYLTLIFMFARVGLANELPDLKDIFKNNKELEDYLLLKILEGHVEFTLDLNRAFVTLHDENVVFSPISLTGILATTMIGSRGNTFHELAKVMHYDKDLAINKYSEMLHKVLGFLLNKLQNSSYDLNYVNGVFVQKNYELRREFVNTVKSNYNSSVEYLDFTSEPQRAKDYINNWIKSTSNGKINELINEIAADSKIILGSSLFFRASWDEEFEVENTKKALFYVEPDLAVEVDMMNRIGDYYTNYDDELDAHLIGIPYKNNEATMFIILPGKHGKEALKNLANKLTIDKLSDLIEYSEIINVDLYVPKMNLTSNLPVKKALEYLGLKSLFNNLADLSVLASGTNLSVSNNEVDVDKVFSKEELEYKLYLDDVLKSVEHEGIDKIRNKPNLTDPELFASDISHIVRLDVNEKGAEGVAVASIDFMSKSIPLKFRVNRPFMFFIRQNNVITFWGTIYEV